MTILTDLMPPAFAFDTLDAFSTTTGRPDTPHWGETTASLNDLSSLGMGTALLVSTASVARVVYKGETPIVPGRYLRVTAQVKMDGFAQGFQARITTYPMLADRSAAQGQPTFTPNLAISDNGIFTVTAVIGTGQRAGVDLVWTPDVAFAHLGVEILSDGTPGTVNIGPLQIEDVSAAYDADSSATIDVRDYGAIADGSTDCTAAFMAADAAANGRTVLIPPGVYRLNDTVSFENPVACQGTLSMPQSTALLLKKNFDLASYTRAFGDVEEGFRRAIGAMLAGVNHKDLDLGGQVVPLSGPVDVAALTDISQINRRYRIQNGTLELSNRNDPVWTPTSLSITAGYDDQANALTNISNIDQIEVGMLVNGNGVGREVYVKSIDIPGKRALLNLPLYGNPATQGYTLTRFKYMLDFAGFRVLDLFELDNVEFSCDRVASAVMLPPKGLVWRFTNCYFNEIGDRAITSPGEADQGMLVDNCNFTQNSNTTFEKLGIAINASANDIKIRHNRAAFFRHFLVIAGQNALILGNHIFQGFDNEQRTGGIVLTQKSMRATIDGNYIDNCFIEVCNEHDLNPTGGFPIGALTITSNNFLGNDLNADFRFINFKPMGANRMQSVSVCNNVFSAYPASSAIDRVEGIDNSRANFTAFSRITFEGNAYVNVNNRTQNPRPLQHTQNSAQSSWTVDFGNSLAFAKGPAHVEAITAAGRINNSGSGFVWSMPQVDFGGAASHMRLYWSEAARGSVVVTARMDDPDG